MTRRKLELSRRKILAGLGTVGAASAGIGMGTTALFTDEETATNNRLTAGKLDLKVSWEGSYYDWVRNERFGSDGEVDEPGPVIELEDVKPGDVLELTLGAHLYGNPGFLGFRYQTLANDDAGITDPEDSVDGRPMNGSDGTPGGDLVNHVRAIVWHDDGDNLPDEIWTGDADVSEGATEAYLHELGAGAEVQPWDPHWADTSAEEVVFAGTLAELDRAGQLLLDSRDAIAGSVADEFPGAACYQPSTVERLGILLVIPRDIPNVEDDLLQSDRLEFEFGFTAVQCRHNVDADGTPIEPPTDPATLRLVDRVVSLYLAETGANSTITMLGPVEPGSTITSAESPLTDDPVQLTIPSTPGEYYVLVVDEEPTQMFGHRMQYAWVDLESETVGTTAASWWPTFMERSPTASPTATGSTSVQGVPVRYAIGIPMEVFEKDVVHDISGKGDPGERVPTEEDCRRDADCKFALVMDFGDAEKWFYADLAAHKAADANRIARWLAEHHYQVQRISQYWGNDVPAVTGDDAFTQLREVFSGYETAFEACCQGDGEDSEEKPIHFFLYITSHGAENSVDHPLVLFDPAENGVSEGLPYLTLASWLTTFPSCVQLTIFVDACFSGQAMESMPDNLGDRVQPTIILTTTDANTTATGGVNPVGVAKKDTATEDFEDGELEDRDGDGRRGEFGDRIETMKSEAAEQNPQVHVSDGTPVADLKLPGCPFDDGDDGEECRVEVTSFPKACSRDGDDCVRIAIRTAAKGAVSNIPLEIKGIDVCGAHGEIGLTKTDYSGGWWMPDFCFTSGDQFEVKFWTGECRDTTMTATVPGPSDSGNDGQPN